MRQIRTFTILPHFQTFQIYDANLDPGEATHEFTEQTTAQGFSKRSESYNFYPLTNCMYLSIEVWLADLQDKIALRSDTVRAIIVPCSVSKAGLMISDVMGAFEELIQVPEGKYALFFEIWPEDEQAALGRSDRQENPDYGFVKEHCVLTFYPRTTPVMPEILRVDQWICPPNLNTYRPLNPVYPLIMEVGLA